ncbi:MAG: TM2 domain-containing protein [Fimbriimonadaceae bacterium]|nr:TM2 domain-containing protein [Fimbriimonadaceae bacterium]
MKDKTVAGLLAVFFGMYGIHAFYLGDHRGGLLRLLFGLFLSPLMMIGGWVEGLQLLLMPQEVFNQRFNEGARPAISGEVRANSPYQARTQATLPADWWRTWRPRSRAEQEQVLLSYIHAGSGSATAAEVSLNTTLSLQQSQALLESMEAVGACQTVYDPQSGLARYVFPELRREPGAAQPAYDEVPLGQRLS